MEGDYYRRTDFELSRWDTRGHLSPESTESPTLPCLPLASPLPLFFCRVNPEVESAQGELLRGLNAKCCMLSSVPLQERVYSTAEGAKTFSVVPQFAGVSLSVWIQINECFSLSSPTLSLSRCARLVTRPQEAVDEGRTAMALGRFGEGCVGFLGDVNHEKDTMHALTTLIWAHARRKGLND